jgi:hypothetical protein
MVAHKSLELWIKRFLSCGVNLYCLVPICHMIYDIDPQTGLDPMEASPRLRQEVIHSPEAAHDADAKIAKFAWIQRADRMANADSGRGQRPMP